MIYTVTFNPSLDYIASCDDYKTGQVNRTSKEIIFPGGKGINVSIVLGNLGVPSTILGFTAGFTGQEIKRLLARNGCQEKMIDLDSGTSRINVKLKSKGQNGDSEETDLNGMGPVIDAAAIERLYKQLDELESGDILVLAGSIPSSMPGDIYMKVMQHVAGKDVEVVVDATRDLLNNVLPYHPFLIKPNDFELGELFGVTIDSCEDAAKYAGILQERGARNVLVSMGAKGAVLITKKGDVLYGQAPRGKVVNSVGAGDSMVAGFLYGYITTKDYSEAFRYGIASGSASAFSENLATKDEVIKLYDSIGF